MGVKHRQGKAENLLLGKKVLAVRFLSEAEAKMMGWESRPLCIYFSDGLTLIPATDEGGSDGGCLYTNNEDLPIIAAVGIKDSVFN